MIPSPSASNAKNDANSSTSKPKNYSCSFCARKFARYEHLYRHERTHTNERPFACIHCAKSFARKDLLVRHEKSMHASKSSSETPLHETHSIQSGSLAHAQAGRQSGTRQTKKMRLRRDEDAADQDIESPANRQSSIQAGKYNKPQLSQAGFHSVGGTFQNVIQSTHQNIATDPGASNDPSAQSFLRAPNSGPGTEQSTSGVLEDEPFGPLLDMQISDFSWIENFDISTTTLSSYFHTAQPLWPMFDTPPSLFFHEKPQQTDPNSAAENINNTRPTPSSLNTKKTLADSRQQDASLFDKTLSRRQSPGPQSSLPINPVVVQPSSRVTAGVRSRVKLKLEPYLHLLPKDFVIPSQHAIGRYVSGFFEGFHLHLPFIHLPTWSPASCHMGLLIAMCALGARYSFEQDSAMMLWKAGKSIIRMETEERGDEFEHYKTEDNEQDYIEICQAMLLLMAFQTWTGDKFLLRQALSFQSALASLVRQEGLQALSQSKEMGWQEWVKYETAKRTKLVVYCFFNLQYLTYNVPPLILNREVELDLPSDEDSWRAESEDMWLQNGRGEAAGTPSFQVALRKLLSENGSSTADESSHILPPQNGSSYSTFGSYILIHGLIQHHFQLRQYSDFTIGSAGALAHAQVRVLERALRNWQQSWEKSPEASLNPRNPHGPLAFDCTAVLRMAYIRLDIDFGPGCAALQSGDPHIIACAIRDQLIVARGPRLTRAALHSCHALLILVKEGIDLVAHTQVFVWSVQRSVASFECCLVLVKWLDAVTDDAVNPPLTEEEKWLITLVQETLRECNIFGVEDIKTLQASVLKVWAKVFYGTTIWGIMPVMGTALKIYADMLSDSESRDFEL